MKKKKLRVNPDKQYRFITTRVIVASPDLSMRHYSQTTRTLNKKRRMILNSLNEASRIIEKEVKFRYD